MDSIEESSYKQRQAATSVRVARMKDEEKMIPRSRKRLRDGGDWASPHLGLEISRCTSSSRLGSSRFCSLVSINCREDEVDLLHTGSRRLKDKSHPIECHV